MCSLSPCFIDLRISSYWWFFRPSHFFLMDYFWISLRRVCSVSLSSGVSRSLQQISVPFSLSLTDLSTHNNLLLLTLTASTHSRNLRWFESSFRISFTLQKRLRICSQPQQARVKDIVASEETSDLMCTSRVFSWFAPPRSKCTFTTTEQVHRRSASILLWAWATCGSSGSDLSSGGIRCRAEAEVLRCFCGDEWRAVHQDVCVEQVLRWLLSRNRMLRSTYTGCDCTWVKCDSSGWWLDVALVAWMTSRDQVFFVCFHAYNAGNVVPNSEAASASCNHVCFHAYNVMFYPILRRLVSVRQSCVIWTFLLAEKDIEQSTVNFVFQTVIKVYKVPHLSIRVGVEEGKQMKLYCPKWLAIRHYWNVTILICNLCLFLQQHGRYLLNTVFK